jgi:hypothetical protein
MLQAYVAQEHTVLDVELVNIFPRQPQQVNEESCECELQPLLKKLRKWRRHHETVETRNR